MFIYNMSDLEKENADSIGFDGMIQQTIEESSEVIKALCKYNRARGIGQKTEITPRDAMNNVIVELADLEICLEQLSYLFEMDGYPNIRGSIDECKLAAFDKVYNRYKKEEEDIDDKE